MVYAQQLTKPNDQLKRTNVEGLKAISIGVNDTTSNLPTGVKFVKGKIAIQTGYKAVYSSDKKIVFITAKKDSDVKGSFGCNCGTGGGSCHVTITSGAILCLGDDCCEMIVSTGNNLSGITMQGIEEAPEKLTWKRIVVPAKSN